MHYIFRSDGRRYPMVSLRTPLPRTYWLDGDRLDFPVPPLELELAAERSFQWVDFFMATSIPLFSPRMRAALEGCGVDNIDYYPARVRNTRTEEVRDYHAANVIGLAECVDRVRSAFEPFDEESILIDSFERLALDEGKSYGLRLFRAAEHSLLLLVADSVKKRLEAHGLGGLMFIKPEEWDGLLT
ncbi:imm11 family protein [Corallococcus terminator]